MLKNSSIYKKALFLAITFTVIIFAVLMILVMNQLEKEIIKNISYQQKENVSLVANNLDSFFINTHRLIIAASKVVPIDQLDNPDMLQQFLDKRSGLLSVFDGGAFLFTSDGKIIAETPYRGSDKRGQDFSFREYMRQTVNNKKPYISDPFISSRTGRASIMFTSPILDSQDNVVAVLCGSMDLLGDNPLSYLKNMKVGETGYYYVYNKQRTMIMHRDGDRIMKNDVPVGANKYFDMAIEGFQGTGRTVNSRGLEYLGTFIQLKSKDWIVVSTVPIKEAFASVKRIGSTIAFIFIVTVIFIIISIVLGLRHFAKPMEQLVSQASQLFQDKKIRQFNISTSSYEINVLVNALNSLLSNLTQRENQIFSLINALPDVISFRDKEGKVIEVNKAMLNILNLRRKDVIGKTDSEIGSIVDKNYYNIFKRLFEKNKISTISDSINRCTIEVSTKEGKWRIFELMDIPIIDNSGKVEAVVRIGRDITSLRQAIDNLKKFFLAVEQSPLSIIITDVMGVIEYANPTACAITGYDMEELIGEKTSIFKSGSIGVDYYKSMWDEIMLGNTWQGELINKKKNGELYDEKAVISPLRDEEGNISKFIAIKEDITQSKMLEERMIEMEKLSTLSVVAGALAHDFNNILTSAIIHIALLKTKAKYDKDIVAILDTLERAIMNSSNISKQLLTFSKGGAPIKELCDIKDIIIYNAEFVAKGTNVFLDIDIDDDLMGSEVDKGQIGQVIGNLVINAIHASPEGGRVMIAARNFDVQADSGLGIDIGKYVLIRIADNGCGIPDDIKEKVFNPFFTTKSTGTGLGLASCKSIITKHGGYIHFTSEVKKGTTFYIYLKAYDNVKDGKYELRSEDISSMNGLKLLLIDDEAGIRDSVEMFLELEGVDVCTFNDWDKAISMLNCTEDKYDIILTDLTIPSSKIGHQDFVAHVHANMPDTKIIAFSGYAEDEIINEPAKYGFSGFLAKPFNIADMKKMILNSLK